jgi:hypothetical protein
VIATIWALSQLIARFRPHLEISPRLTASTTPELQTSSICLMSAMGRKQTLRRTSATGGKRTLGSGSAVGCQGGGAE